MILFIQLLLAHLAGDFFLQPSDWVRQKEERNWQSPLLYVHVLIHFVLILFFRFDLGFWLPALVIAFTHLVIDLIKVNYQRPDNRRTWFFIDQGLHLLVLLVAAFMLASPPIDLLFLHKPAFLVVLAGV